MRTRARRTTNLGVEPLEHRSMLSADPGWAFTQGGPSHLTDSAVNVGPDNYLYVAGSFEGTTDFDPGPGTVQLTAPVGLQDGFVAKYSPQGSLVWVTRFGGADGVEECSALEFDAAGNVYVMGSLSSSAPTFGAITLNTQGSYDVFATKIDAGTGAFLWARSFGGPNVDAGPAGAVSAAGDVYVTGYFRNTADFDPNPASTFNLTAAGGADEADAFIWNLDTQGNFAWARQFGNEALDTGQRLALGGDGYAYFAGTFRDTVDFGNPGDPMALTSVTPGIGSTSFVKLDEITGQTAWARVIGGAEKVTNAKIVANGAGELYLAGGFTETVGFGGGTPTLVSQGLEDSYLSQWDTDGNFVWAKAIASGPGSVIIDTLRLDAAGSPLLSFAFNGTKDFDPGPQTANLTSFDQSDDGAVLKLNADGSFGWVRQMSGLGVTQARGVVADAAGNVYVSGFFQYNVTLSTGHVLTGGQRGNYLMKLAFGDPATKFYVVDDASGNRTHEYDASGTTNGNNGLNSGNSAPRGAASTAVGDRVWVVDANRKVYVYDINGSLLGSWTAGTMASNATPEGIATNGTDVWIVDSKSDKVYKYAGAASRISGSQNAASNFSLNSANADPKDIVTNGTSLWVVNDSSTDKVFKYSVAGSLLGSWTIGSANSKPTGLTIDPANVSDIWIVDSGTDRVYQYAGATSRTSGSQAPLASFALAAGNTNPQGIADPPPAGGAAQVARANEVSGPARQAEFAPALRGADRTGKAAQSLHKGTVTRAREAVFQSFAVEQWSPAITDWPKAAALAAQGGGDDAADRDADAALVCEVSERVLKAWQLR